MEKKYNPKEIEKSIYDFWENQGFFKPQSNICTNSYCITIPPPNITGSLHMGHAFQQTIMDIMIRYNRMQGKNTLWQTGTDHAGIATQIVVENKIFYETGKNLHEYNKSDFINEILKWKTHSVNTISNQMRKIGSSVDWSRERFTMDYRMSNAVKEAFIRLYKGNLIYRGKRLVNWDPKLHTVISDLEIKNKKLNSLIWYLRYPLSENSKYTTDSNVQYLVVATTRPETIFGDTGIAVHPDDSRYHNLIGKSVILPIINCRIPIIGDKHVNMHKGTGCVKVTPAHDFDDYNIGRRHGLPIINILTLDGRIRKDAQVFDTTGKINTSICRKIPKYFQELERLSARKAILSELNRLGLLVSSKPHDSVCSYSSRSGAIVEPMLTDQWYIRTKPLSKVAIQAVEEGKIKFIPKQYENMYFSWMQNIQDWCISRQLLWGHRIPVWYDNDNNFYVGYDENDVKNRYKLDNNIILNQDNDVLDTWFSSGLWTFSSLGWPDDTDLLKIFHPTDVIVSGFDIIFFWIARMIMMSMYLIKDKNGHPQVPFKTVYITGLIRDEEGKKMSKSEGNIIDPIDIIEGISLADLLKKRTSNMMQPHLKEKIKKCTKRYFPNGIPPYGADALRFTLTSLASTSRDINWDMKRLNGYRNFCNKLWNASRFVVMNITKKQCISDNKVSKIFSLADRWILIELNTVIKEFREALDSYRFDLSANILYEFVWNQFCNWYLEFAKSIIKHGNYSEIYGTFHTLELTLELILRLSHPIIPFITEAIWKYIKDQDLLYKKKNFSTIMLQSFPTYNSSLHDQSVVTDLNWIKQIVNLIRSIRSKRKLHPNQSFSILLRNFSPNVKKIVESNLSNILYLARINKITLLPHNGSDNFYDKKNFLSQSINDTEILIPIIEITNNHLTKMDTKK